MANSLRKELLAENENLRLRLEEAEDTLRAIGSGEVDAFVVSGPDGEQVFTLKGAEQPYRVLVETMNEGAATLAADGSILYCNSRLAAMLQVPLEKLIGTQLGSYVAPADHPLFTARLGMCSEECDKDEIIMITAEGNSVPVIISYCAPDFSSSQVIYVVATDLTQQKRNEENMASEKLARSIIEQAGEAIVICDEEGRITRASRLVHQLCNGNPLLKLFNELFQLRIIETECLFSVLPPLHGECFKSVEVEFKRSDDQIFNLLLNARPLISVQDRIIGCVVTLTDISERKRVEEALRESEERFRAIFEQAAVGIGEVSPDRRWLRVNRKLCEIIGYTEEELKALSIGEITHPYDLETSLKHFQLLQEGEVGNYFLEKRYIRKDGSTVWVNLTVSGISDASGNLKFAAGVVVDITERKRAEEEIKRLNTDLAARAAELETANQELEAFNYTVAHDLRKPLTVVNGYCQAIRELYGDKLDERCRRYLQETYDGTWRMNRLIDALLNFSRLAHVEMCRETVDLSAMAHEVAVELKLAEPERRVTFLIAGGVSHDGDAALLRVVLNNLLGNAWKYTGTGDDGIIEFGTTEVDGKPEYFVRDNGIGFDMADADKLFTAFRRLPGAEECRGFGIGLATVERIIRRHGGRVWAEGEPGKGACLYFTLSEDGVSI